MNKRVVEQKTWWNEKAGCYNYENVMKVKFSIDGVTYYKTSLENYDLIMKFINEHANEITVEQFLAH